MAELLIRVIGRIGPVRRYWTKAHQGSIDKLGLQFVPEAGNPASL